MGSELIVRADDVDAVWTDSVVDVGLSGSTVNSRLVMLCKSIN